MHYLNRILIVLISVVMLGTSVRAQDTSSTKHDLNLSPELLELLLTEMRELLVGVQSLSAGIAKADWKDVANTSAQIQASYILEKKLTAAQRSELSTSLPEHFKRLDADFHLEAKKLEAAANNHDSQLSAFHFYRLIESCTACHTEYATSRFPGFSPTAGHSHTH